MRFHKILFILIFSSILIFPGHHTTVLTPSVSSGYYSCDDGTYGSSNNISYGGSQTQHHYTYESVYKFSFAGLPSNTCNISATLEAYRTSGSVSGNIVKVPDNLNFSDYPACYSAVGNGQIKFSVDNGSGQQHDVSSYFGSTIDPNGNINFSVAPTVPNGTANISIKLTINYDLLFDVTFQNEFKSVSNGGTIIVNGTQYNSPATGFYVQEGGPITGIAPDQTINGIDYTFIGWYGSTLISTERTHIFYPTDNITYTAKYTGTPNVTNMNPYSNNGNIGQHPTIYWTDNVNANVSYDVYQQTYDGTTWSSWAYLSHVNKGVGHFICTQYSLVSGRTLNLALKLNAVYSIENTVALGGTQDFTVFPTWMKRNFGNNQTDKITEYKLYDNFPNPFNPSTEVYYQIPNDGNVKLKVYNMMGQEIMTLVNEFKAKGMYNVSFNAARLPSGMYIYKLEAGSFVQVKKMLLTK